MGDEIEDLRHNLKVSFSRMKSDIHSNQEKIDKLLEINKQLQEQIKRLESKIVSLEAKPQGLKSELLRSFKRNKKQIIKQRILSLIKGRQMPVAELKEAIVDDKNYCSKATFYRYIDELKKVGIVNSISIDGNDVIVLTQEKAVF
ncbi:hypothetical protein A3K72_04200 [Candidatus Woesearchaeota archaeon RBG_13_36_6]|nr:MAG: hypothetical protein A3K72_04200 [Candidatus Woesearchaeota archaeon RBG_13_36_6]